VYEFEGKGKQETQAFNGWNGLNYARQVGRIRGHRTPPQDQLLELAGLLTEKGKDRAGGVVAIQLEERRGLETSQKMGIGQGEAKEAG
jgi:hypothetical protein